MKRRAGKIVVGAAVAAGLMLGLSACAAEPTVPVPSDEFDPFSNENVEVYGPPEWFDEGEDFDPSENMVPAVYGPPEAFEGTELSTE